MLTWAAAAPENISHMHHIVGRHGLSRSVELLSLSLQYLDFAFLMLTIPVRPSFKTIVCACWTTRLSTPSKSQHLQRVTAAGPWPSSAAASAAGPWPSSVEQPKERHGVHLQLRAVGGAHAADGCSSPMAIAHRQSHH